jgi:7,8-dihydropterin-6-yl-methyl-4-(beta-D-ribofuranosyl)aminobenzene 5'-phosphate synthase
MWQQEQTEVVCSCPRFAVESDRHVKNRERKTIGCVSMWQLVTATCIVFVLGLAGKTPAEVSLMNETVQGSIQDFKITVLSTMLVGQLRGIGEWGFSALVDVDRHRILVDTGNRPDTVLKNAQELNIDLPGVQEVVLTHFHWDHVGGLLTLRRELMKQNPRALSMVHVPEGIFNSRPSSSGESNQMIAIRKEYEATGGHFIEYPSGTELLPGVWFTGPVPRVYPEHNWSGSGKVLTPSGLVEDNIPEDSSVVLNTQKGLVIITGCGHAGIVNIVTAVVKHFGNRPIFGIAGGMHMFAASDAVVDWTATELKKYQVKNLFAAHCTGIEATYRLRAGLGLNRQTAVVAGVGSSFSSVNGIEAGLLAK